ncbi:MAG: hypothetical protein WC702_04845 [Patescibacteria group bacterium]|jgi:hypothetical protein
MQNKLIAVFLLSISLVLSGAGCTSSPSSRVDDLEQEKAANLESSGYNECVARIEARTAAHTQCVKDKIVADGYTDGLDCIGSYENPICQDTTRYNTEVNASNDCYDEVDDSTTDLTLADCLKLLEE